MSKIAELYEFIKGGGDIKSTPRHLNDAKAVYGASIKRFATNKIMMKKLETAMALGWSSAKVLKKKYKLKPTMALVMSSIMFWYLKKKKQTPVQKNHVEKKPVLNYGSATAKITDPFMFRSGNSFSSVIRGFVNVEGKEQDRVAAYIDQAFRLIGDKRFAAINTKSLGIAITVSSL